MNLRIGVMHTLPAEEGTEGAHYAKDMNALIRKNMDLVKAEGTEITFQFPRIGLDGFGAFQYAFMNTLNDMETLHGYMQMAQSGHYDAVIGWCFYDPVMREGRQVMEIPLVCPAETCMKLATMMGAKFGVVTTSEKTQWSVEELIHKYYLKEQSVGAIGIRCSFKDQVNALTDARPNIDGFIEVSRELITRGAEVIIPGCMLADTCLRMAPGCEDEYPNGLTEVDGVPILNVTAVTLKMAETFAALYKTNTPFVSKKLYYSTAKGDQESLKEGARILEYKGPGFWQDSA